MTQYVTQARRKSLPPLELSAQAQHGDIGNQRKRRAHARNLLQINGRRAAFRNPDESSPGKTSNKRAHRVTDRKSDMRKKRFIKVS